MRVKQVSQVILCALTQSDIWSSVAYDVCFGSFCKEDYDDDYDDVKSTICMMISR